MGIKELDAGVVGCVGSARDAALIAQMQQIAAHLALAQLIRGAPIVCSKAANPLYVDLLGRGRQTGSGHVRDHALTQLSHRGHPPFELPETSVPALEEISSIASPRETCSNYGEAVQSNVFYVMPTAPSNSCCDEAEQRVFLATRSLPREHS